MNFTNNTLIPLNADFLTYNFVKKESTANIYNGLAEFYFTILEQLLCMFVNIC